MRASVFGIVATLCWPLGSMAFQEPPAVLPTPAGEVAVEDLLGHYARVERELRAARVEGISPEAMLRRARAIEALREYRERADFGRNLDFPGERKPYFVDAQGRHCAVAWLMHRDGRDELIERIRSDANHAWVIELVGDPELGSWLAQTGLSPAEAARIQAPAYSRWMPVNPPNWNASGAARPRAGPAQPEPSAPEGPSGPGTPAGPRPTASPRPAAQPPPTPATPTNAPSSLTGADVGPEAWWTWWELHKLDYLRPNLLRNWVSTITRYAGDAAPSNAALDGVRAELRPSIDAALASGDGMLRGSAAIALGRMGGAGAVSALKALLADPSVEVRERALLALGSTGCAEAASLLIDIARTGSAPDARTQRISADARALAVLALAIGRRAGMDERVDFELGRLALELDSGEESLLQASLLLYQTIHPTPALSSWVLRRAGDPEAHFGVGCRALETLRTRTDDEALALLTRELSGRSLERRRSAALALGEFEHELALPALMTAAELEREPLTRGFVLISVGRQGGEKARALLVEELREGPKNGRSWAALALGILARSSDDDAARSALRESLGTVKDKSVLGAYYLALGIARDAGSEKLFLDALEKGATAEIRAVSAMGLAMIDAPSAREALRKHLVQDPCPTTRAEIAQALGYLGDARDSELLLAALRETQDPSLRSNVALALGLHGTRPSLEGLVSVARESDSSSSLRAASFESLQVVLGLSPGLTVGELLRQSNFSVFPPTLVRVREVLL